MRALLPLILIASLPGATAARAASPLPLMPLPASATPGAGSFSWARATLARRGDDPGTTAAADRLADLLGRGGKPLARARSGQAPTIRFVLDRSVSGSEAYRLAIMPAGITVRASGDAGLFYGAETLWQLAAARNGGNVAAVTIDDHPAFGWRGLMLDSARHFQTVATIEQLLDRMAAAKLNVFHWHLTDDQGWRLAIARYPRLTAVGAWRIPAGAEGRDAAGRPRRYGGFYSADDVRAVVAYAAARHITIVPEIEMPGHATAAIAAYPALASATPAPTAPSSAYGILPNLFSPDEASFAFLHNVLDEVMALFPGRYIHVGGDEAIKDQWKANPAVQARIKALGLKDEDALQGWFTARIGAYLSAHGRRLIGWDEILQGGVPADATVMSWRGTEGAIAAAKAGHDTVLSPAPILYLDNRQSDAADEPPGRGTVVSWHDLYAFDPLPPAIGPAERPHVLGLQVNLWTEQIRTAEETERMIWPRAAIAAELGWSAPATRDWSAFSERLLAELDRWRALGWRYDETPLTVQARIEGGAVSLVQPAGIGTVHYALGGQVPTAASPVAGAAIPIDAGLDLAAQSFVDGRPTGPIARWNLTPASLRTRAAAEMSLCGNKLPIRIGEGGADAGTRRSHWVDAMQPCWIWRGAPLDGIASFTAEVAQVAYNFAFASDVAPPAFRRPRTAAGELEIRQDGCDGNPIAVLPLATNGPAGAEHTIRAAPDHPIGGTHDLCLTFTQAQADPLSVLDRLTLVPAARP